MLSILKKKAAAQSTPEVEEPADEVVEETVEDAAEEVVGEEAVEEEPAPKPKTVIAKKTAPPAAPSKPAIAKAPAGLLMRGKHAQEAMQKEKVKSELAMRDRLFRYWMEKNEDGRVTFLDGDIKDGAFTNPCAYEHYAVIAGKPRNLICVQEFEPCPICESSDNRYAFVTYFTVIDHREWKSKKENGKVYKDQRKLFVAKRNTVTKLLKLAQKRGGLRGCTFDVSRGGDKNAANVGDTFDFDSKMTEQELRAAYSKRKRTIGEKTEIVDDSVPFDYERMVEEMFLSAVDLRKMGFGGTSVGGEAAPEEAADAEEHDDL